MPKSGDICEQCGTRTYIVYKSAPVNGVRRQALICPTCRHQPRQLATMQESHVRQRPSS